MIASIEKISNESLPSKDCSAKFDIMLNTLKIHPNSSDVETRGPEPISG